METLRFLMVTTFYPPYHIGGDAVHVRHLAEALAERGHDVHVEFAPAAFRLKGGVVPDAIEDSDGPIQLHTVPSPLGKMQPIASYLLGRSRSVTQFHSRLVGDIKPDVVHYHNISLLGLGVLSGPRADNTFYTSHDYWIRCPRNDLFKYSRYPCEVPTCVRCGLVSLRPPQLWRSGEGWKGFSRLDSAIAPSAFMKSAIEQELTCPVVEIPNLAPDPNPQGRISEPGDYYLFVGVHESHKGILELASAAARSDGLSFIFVGRGRQLGRLQKMRSEGLINIEARGWLEPTELAPLYRGARGLIVPSLSHENSPLAGIEALSWGTPLLVSQRGGLEELIHGRKAGISFEPHVAGILSAIEQFEDKGLYRGLRQQARLVYETYHHPARYLERYMPLIRGTDGESAQMMSARSVAVGRKTSMTHG